MTWVRLDDRFPDHPKVLGLTALAFRAHVEALCYCGAFDTGGRLPRVVVKARWGRQAAALVAAGLWEQDGDDYLIHDWEDYNPAGKARERRHEGKVAGGKARAARAARDGGRFTSRPPASTTSSAPAADQQERTSRPAEAHQQTTSPGPDPLPDPEPDHRERDPDHSPPTPSLRLEFWNRATAMSGLLSLGAQDEALLDSWIERGATVETWERAETELAGWSEAPRNRWAAFRRTMGNLVAQPVSPSGHPRAYVPLGDKPTNPYDAVVQRGYGDDLTVRAEAAS